MSENGRSGAWQDGRMLIVPWPGTPTWPLTIFLAGLGAHIDREADDLTVWSEPTQGQPLVRVASREYVPDLAARLASDGVRPLILIRDPRDAAAAVAARDSVVSPLEAVAAQIEAFAGWRDRPCSLVLRYEDVCPPAYGGDEGRQVAAFVGLAAALGWRGSAFALVQAILGTQSTTGDADSRSLVGLGSALLSDAPSESESALQALALDWGYAASPVPAVRAGQGALGGLLAALANEHLNVRDELISRLGGEVVNTRTELRRVEAAARLVQQRLEEERTRFRPLRRVLSLVASAAAQGERLLGRR